jgi:hypothetical protein
MKPRKRLLVDQLDWAEVGMHADGGCLYLQVRERKGQFSRSWIFRYTALGRERHMGLGSLQNVSLAEARQRATDARKLLENGRDPIDTRQ